MTDSEKLDLLITKTSSLETKVDSLETKVDSLETRVDSMDKRLCSVERGLLDSKGELRLVRAVIENELNHNVKLIAEGHYDLNRKVDDAIHSTLDIAAKEEVYDVKHVLYEAKLKELAGRMDLYAG